MDTWLAAAAATRRTRSAVRAPGFELTYAQLDRLAASIAQQLRPLLSAVADPVVGVALDRSPLFLAAVLACWKAGAAYLPLDAQQPPARISFMLDDAGADAVVTDTATIDHIGYVEQPAVVADRCPPSDPRVAARVDPHPGRLAYVIYTSGSTGEPKGVGVEHRNLVHYVRAVVDACGVGEEMHWAAVSSFTTDLAHTALFVSLATGGCAHVLPKDLVMDPLRLERYFARARIDAVKTTPSHLAALLAGSARPLPRRLLILGGEPLPWELVRRVRHGGTCAIYNHYGPTETTVGACVYRCDTARTSHQGIVPIGRPLPGVAVTIAGAHGGSAGAGEIGEIEIAGPTLSRGYVNRQIETAERFVAARPGRTATRVVYRTGDLGRLLPDGNIEFLGRADQQVKIRGYRVEPAEIEAALVTHPDITSAIVAAHVDGDGRATLVAHYVALSSDLRPNEVESFLRGLLPDYMVPSELVRVPSIPLLPSGKADVSALDHPGDGNAPRPGRPAEPPARGVAALEAAVVDIYRDVLDKPQLSPLDDFFDSGGDSLCAVEIVARVRDLVAAEVPVAYVFTRRTPRNLADALVSSEG